MSDHDKPTLDLALTIARWDDTKDPATNAIPHWAVNLAMALIESDWLSEHDRQVAERAWYKGHSTGIFDKQYETGTRNPYTRKEQS